MVIQELNGGFGQVASKRRTLKSGAQYDKLIDSSTLKGTDPIVKKNGTVHDTLRHMHNIVKRTLGQTAKLSKKLEGSSLKETCSNIWHFLYEHVQYKKDREDAEQTRQPARTWKDRVSGVDCDCYSIFISSVLTNLGIPHALRMTSYKEAEGKETPWQHVYVVVPKDGKSISAGSYIIDPVTDNFNYEVPFKQKYDSMSTISSSLSGVDTSCPTTPRSLRMRQYISRDQIINAGLVPTGQLLENHNIPFTMVDDPSETQGYYVVQTPQGSLKLPSIITPEIADQVVAVMSSTGSPATGSCGCDSGSVVSLDKLKALAKKINWWWVAAGALGLLLISGGGSKPVSGLDGVPAKKKAKTAKRSASRMSI